MKIVLDIGCGHEKIKAKKGERVIGVDALKDKDVDIVHNLERPLPFPDNYANRIYSNHTFEHVQNAKQLVEECWRVTKAGGEIFIRVPHYSSTLAYSDMTHKTFFSSRSLDFYINGADLEKISGYNRNIRFRIVKKQIVFDWPYKFFEVIVNAHHTVRKLYEWFFCWIFPAREIIFIIKPIKKNK